MLAFLSRECTFAFDRAKEHLRFIVRRHVCVLSCECTLAFFFVQIHVRYLSFEFMPAFLSRILSSKGRFAFFCLKARFRFIDRRHICDLSCECTFVFDRAIACLHFYRANVRLVFYRSVSSNESRFAFLSSECPFTVLSIRFFQRKQVCILIERMHARVVIVPIHICDFSFESTFAFYRANTCSHFYRANPSSRLVLRRHVCVLSCECTFAFSRPNARLRLIVRRYICVISIEARMRFYDSKVRSRFYRLRARSCSIVRMHVRDLSSEFMLAFLSRECTFAFHRTKARLRFTVRMHVSVFIHWRHVSIRSCECTLAFHRAMARWHFYRANPRLRFIARRHVCV